MTPFEDRFLQEIEEYIGFEIPMIDAPAKKKLPIGKLTLKQKRMKNQLLKRQKMKN